MRTIALARKCLLAVIILTSAFILFVLMSTSEHSTSPHRRLKQFARHLAESVVSIGSPTRCQPAVGRSEDEIKLCFRALVEDMALSKQQQNGLGSTWTTGRGRLGAKITKQQARRHQENRGYPRQIESRKLLTGNPWVEKEILVHGRNFSLDLSRDIEKDTFGLSNTRTGTKTQKYIISDHKIPGEHSGNQEFQYLSLLKNLSNAIHNKNSAEDFQNDTTASRRPMTTEEMEKRFSLRREILQQACRRFGNASLFRKVKTRVATVPTFWPSSNVRVRYCPIQKTGSTTWANLLKAIRQQRTQRHKVFSADGFHSNENKTALNAAAMKYSRTKAANNSSSSLQEVSFVFVRKPYSRLLSAYVDKLFAPNTLFWTKTGKYVIKNFRDNPSAQSLRCGHDVTFPEFIRYVIHAQETGAHRDGHFVPTHDHCDLCEKKYEYIGHLETLGEDMPFLLKLIHDADMSNLTKEFEHSTLENNAAWIFNRMKKGIKNCMSMDEAGRRLWKKWHIRGLISKSDPFPFSPEQAETVSQDEIFQAAVTVMNRSGRQSDRKKQKKEALMEAYSLVPFHDIEKLRELLFLDFYMFGFDPEPEEVFSKNPIPDQEKDSSYFKF
ncbi:uncharacterized protein [Littorina saxatilis]|uniref:uncharacterized protein isoform X1 n=1 Tax=Littorina saxatilis TaxID=31220 RepID=UPI0038B69C56